MSVFSRWRIFVKPVGFLLIVAIGAVANIIVAWGLAISRPPFDDYRLDMPPGFQPTANWYYFPDRFGATSWQLVDGNDLAGVEIWRYVFSGEAGNGSTRSIDEEPMPEMLTDLRVPPDAVDVDVDLIRTGWPWPSMAAAFSDIDLGEQLGWRWAIVVSKDASRHLNDDILPLHPVILGFVLNTGLYAVVLAAIICGPLTLRRIIRRRRGRCAKCNYPVGTSAVCTECGVKIKSRSIGS